MKNFHAGTIVNQGYYKAFVPNSINIPWEIDDMEVIKLMSQADRQVGRLDMYSEYVNLNLYIRMHIAKEATQSSRIEGTRVETFDAILQLQASMEHRLKPLGGRASDALKVIQELYQNPVINATSLAAIIQKSSVSAYRLLSELESLAILEEITGGQRGRVYVFRDYLKLFESNSKR